MFQFLTVFAQRRLEYGSDVHNLLKRYHASLEDENSKSDVDDDDLLKWAEIFGKIDANANSYIDKEEFESYVQYNYSSPLKTKKDCKEVLTVAMERFTAAVMDHPQDKDFGGLEFKHFVKMMQALQKDAENGGETVHKFYDFLTKVKAKKQREEDSTSAKIIEKAAEWRNGITINFGKYSKLYDIDRTEANFNIFDDNPHAFFIVIRAQLSPSLKQKTQEENFEVARAILTRTSVLRHITERGKPHKETCLNHAYLIEQCRLARLIVKLDFHQNNKSLLHDSSYRGKVFYGENCLHIMIAKNESKKNTMLDEAKWLLGMESDDNYIHEGSDGTQLKKYLYEHRRKLLHQPAVGTFFDRDDPQCKAYFGEFPLSFAVSRNSYEFVKFLVVDCNCWMDKQDKHGNTAAHLAVFHDNFPMFLFLWKLWDLGAKSGKGRSKDNLKTKFLDLESNFESNGGQGEFGLTPLVYAAHLGKVEFFTKLWDYMGRSSVLDEEINAVDNQLMPIQWKWGSIRQFLYPLEQIDPIGQICYFDTDFGENPDKKTSEEMESHKRSVAMKKLALKSVPIFENATEDTLDEICSKMELRCFKRGTQILCENEPSNGKMYIIQTGSCEFFKLRPRFQLFKLKQRLQLKYRYFGELGALGRQHDERYKLRSATVTTAIDSDIWELNLPNPLPNLQMESDNFLKKQAGSYEKAGRSRCVMNEALSQVTSNIMRKSQDEESPHLKLLNSGLLKELIDRKWKRFGEQKFNTFLNWSIFLYVINLLATIMRYPGKQSSSSFLVEQTHTFLLNGHFSSPEELGLFSTYANFQFLLCFLPDVVVIISSIFELRRSWRYYYATYGMKWKPVLLHKLSSCLAILTLLAYAFETFILFGVNSFLWIPVVLVISCSIIRSIQIIVFLLASATQGEFVLMIMTIMFQDMPQFMMIVIVLTFAFSQVFLLLITLVGSNAPVATTVMGSIDAFWKMLFKNFKHVFGDGFEDEENKTKEHILLEFSSLIAALAITIVLVNMLIASMSETFNRVRASKTSEMMYQKAKMITMIELDMPLEERIQKKFWVEVKPFGCAEKKPFMVWHDDGVAATENPESATFPDTCEVTLNWPDAELLNKKKGIIVGVRDPVSNQYSVQLQDEDVIKAWGSTVVQASESQIKWRMPENPTLSDKEKQYVEKTATKKLPARPYIYKNPPSQSDFSTRAPVVGFVSPDTLATESSNLRKDTPAAVSPVKQRSLISRSPGQSHRGISSQERRRTSTSPCASDKASPCASDKASDDFDPLIVPQQMSASHSESIADAPKAAASPQPTPTKRPKRKLSGVEQREAARVRLTPTAVSKTTVSKRVREEDVTVSLRSQRNLRSKK